MTDLLLYRFPISGVETYVFLPPLVMFAVSAMTSMGGLSGAFALLPFQMSVLGYTAPGVTATNLVYNVVAIPGGVLRHLKERRLAWPLATLLIGGTVPGMLFGAWIRTRYLLEPERFKVFVGVVLLLLGARMLLDAWRGNRRARPNRTTIDRERVEPITGGRIGLRESFIEVGGRVYRFGTMGVTALSCGVGVIGGAYGIGGGAVMAPYCIAVLRLPVGAVSGAALLSTWVASLVAAIGYRLLPLTGNTLSASPDWLLGVSFGLGGLAGIYLGARLQHVVPTRLIKIAVAAALVFIAVRYLQPSLGL